MRDEKKQQQELSLAEAQACLLMSDRQGAEKSGMG